MKNYNLYQSKKCIPAGQFVSTCHNMTEQTDYITPQISLPFKILYYPFVIYVLYLF